MRISSRLAGVVIAALLVPILPFVLVGELPGERWLSAADANAVQFGASGAGLLAADVLLPVPSSIIGSLLGARLGLASGFMWTWAGLTLGSLIGWTAGRLALGGLGAHTPRTPTLLVVFLSRPVPVLAEATTLVAGAARMAPGPFLAVCAAGNGVYALVLSGNGAALLPDALIGPGLAIPMALPVAAWLVWRWLARRPGGASHNQS